MLAGKRVTTWPDHDEAGRRYCETVVAELAKCKPWPTIRLSDVAHRVALENAVRTDKLEVIFLDPTYLLLSGVSDQASNYLITADALSMLAAHRLTGPNRAMLYRVALACATA